MSILNPHTKLSYTNAKMGNTFEIPPPPYSDNDLPPPYPTNPYDLPQPIYERLFEIAYLSKKVHCYGRLYVLFKNLRHVHDINTANTVILDEMNVIRKYLSEFNNDEVSALFHILRPFV